MRAHLQFYIDGAWVDPVQPRAHDVVNPATEEPCARISLGGPADVDKAVAAARRAFDSFSQSPRKVRAELLDAIIGAYQKRFNDLADAVSAEMGAPAFLARNAQVPAGIGHLMEARRLVDAYEWEYMLGSARILREPVGVVGMITPWNWPLNQIACKVGPAIAAGCTMVLKPSEMAPLNAVIFAEIMHEAGVPAGVFNLVNGDGPGVGAALSAHAGVDMMSFTGSTRAGVAISKAGADTIKRIALELGGKSPNIILDDANFAKAVAAGMTLLASNTGQSCNAPSRMLAPRAHYETIVEIAANTARAIKVAMPAEGAERGMIGPLSSANQYEKVQAYIQKGIDEGARLVAGGLGRPEGFNRGYFVKPTVFADVTNDMTIAREEIFGPVLSIIPYEDEDDAVRIANDTPYGLAGYIQSGSVERARNIARRIRAGVVAINDGQRDMSTPFGGYKQSGNGREWGPFGLEEYLEVKAVPGWG